MDNIETVEQIFAERLLVVPDYQRGYAWENRQLREFVEDLELLSGGKDHYTGTVILHPQDVSRPRDAAGKSYAVAHVVDGQQRMTTIVLLLNAIRRELAELGHDELPEGIKRSYVATPGLDGRPMFKLTLNRDTNDFFTRTVLADEPGIDAPTIQSQVRLAEADQYFCNYLEDKRNERDDYETWLFDLFDKVTTQLKLTLYNVSEQSDVGVIFETMNDRGKELTDLEKVKNFLLYAASRLEVGGSGLAESVNAAWSDILENMMRAHLTASAAENQFLRAHWIMSYDPQSRNWLGSKSVKDRFQLKRYVGEHDRLREELYDYAESLRSTSRAYCEVVEPRHHDAFRNLRNDTQRAEVIQWSDKLRRTRQLASFLPLLIATRLRFPEDGNAYLQVLQLCERFAFRVYLLQRSPAHSGQTQLFKIANGLYRGTHKLDQVLDETRGLVLAYSRRFDAEFDLENERSWYQWGGIKYFLYEYEDHLSRDRAPRLSWDELDRRDKAKSIEHILPQTPEDPYWLDRFTEEEREKYTHELGNLALTQDNSSYSNKSFPEKKGHQGLTKPDGKPLPCYANSTLVQETQLTRHEEWTPTSILARRAELVEWALQRWHVDPAPLIELPDEADDVDVSESPVVVTGLLPEPELGYETESPRSTRKRGAGAWTWEDYYKHTRHAPAKIDRVKELAERIKEFASQEPTTSINQVVFRAGKTKVCALQFWGDTVIVAVFGIDDEPVPNPWPDFKNKRFPNGWAWYITQNDDVPRDLGFLRDRFEIAKGGGSP